MLSVVFSRANVIKCKRSCEAFTLLMSGRSLLLVDLETPSTFHSNYMLTGIIKWHTSNQHELAYWLHKLTCGRHRARRPGKVARYLF